MITDTELKTIYGGFSFSAAFLNALVKGVSTFFEIGKRIGSSIRRVKTGTICK